MRTAKNSVSSAMMDMCNGPMARNIIRFAIPLMISRLTQLLFNAADIIVVSNFCGEDALAAVGSTTSLINLLLNLLVGMSTATNILAARHLGEGRFDKVSKLAHTSILISLSSGIFFAILGILISRPALVLMKSPENVIDLSTLYLRIYCMGIPASIVYNFGAALLNAKGDTKKPLYIISVSGVINFLLNLFFVTVLKMSVDGVAYATIISQYISAARIINCLVKDESPVHIDIKKLKLYKEHVADILKIGIPSGLQGMVFSFSNMTVQSSVNYFGKDVMAAYAATNSIQGFLYTVCNAFYNAALTFTSQNVGAGKWDRVKRVLLINLGFVCLCGISVGVLCFVFARPLLGIYIKDPAIIEIGITCSMYIALPVFLCGVMEVVMGGVRGMGYATVTMLVATFGTCGTRILWVATIFNKFRTIESLFSVYAVSWLVTIIAHTTCFCIIYTMRKRKAQLNTV